MTQQTMMAPEQTTTSMNNDNWPQHIAALVPVYNHAKTVAAVVSGLRAMGASVYVVDDGSSDGSGEAGNVDGATLISHDGNKGKAQALLTGMFAAQKDGFTHVLSIDADGQHPLNEVPKLIDASLDISEAIIIGRRDMSVAPNFNQFGRWLSNYAIRLACGKWVGDSQSGMRVYPLDSLLQLPLTASRYAFENEILVRASWRKIPVRYVLVKVIYPDDRITHFNKIRDNTITCSTTIELIWRRFLPFRQIVKKKKKS
ncbi:MAG: glycosyltransferase family 2 protein [Planctomycetes bacterium]|nr:glycosyltransferase family 2 protein [Planctomycetota bacterium]